MAAVKSPASSVAEPPFQPGVELPEIKLGIGQPAEASPATVKALSSFIAAVKKDPKILTTYPDEARQSLLSRPVDEESNPKKTYLEASEVFAAIDPDRRHDIPEGLAVLATQGIRFAFEAYISGLTATVQAFNNAALVEALSTNRPYLPLVAPVISPVPTFDEFQDVMDIQKAPYETLTLPEEKEYALSGALLDAAMKKIHARPNQIPGGLILISPHSLGHIYTREELIDIYRAMQAMNNERLAKLTALMGGPENIKAWQHGVFTDAHRQRLQQAHIALFGEGGFDIWLQKTVEGFQKAMAFLPYFCGMEDGAYFGSEADGQRSISLQSLGDACPGVNERFFTALSASKTGGIPNAQTGVAITGQALKKWYQPSIDAASVGGNGMAHDTGEAVFNPRHKHAGAARNFVRRRNRRFYTGRAVVENLLKGTPLNGAGNGQTIIDPLSGQEWINGIPGVSYISTGPAGMFRAMRFDRDHWQPWLDKHAPGQPFDKAMYKFLTKHMGTIFTPPWKMKHPDNRVFRIKCDAPPKEIVEALARLRHVGTLFPLPPAQQKPEIQQAKVLAR
jgi:hypothetical protein